MAKWARDSADNFADDMCFGEELAGLICAEDSLRFGSQKQYWINSNWVDADDAHGEEIVQMMRTYLPVRAVLLDIMSSVLICLIRRL